MFYIAQLQGSLTLFCTHDESFAEHTDLKDEVIKKLIFAVMKRISTETRTKVLGC